MHSETLQSFLPVTLLLGSVFFGILMNRRDSSRLDESIGRRFDEVDRRFNEANRRFDEKLDEVNRKFDDRFDEVNRKFDDRFEEVNRKFDEVNRRLSLIEADQKNFFTVTGKLDGRIDELSRR